ncbi:MAG: hypothetical protein LBC65_05430 [Oscillospiraceae bacterium]|jgi:hypothetical protein|nr:hypothetical protein [Oscillospiraceae bacterium]
MRRRISRTYILTAILFILVAILAVRGLNTASEASGREQVRTLTNSVRRAIVSCYAQEGAYPDTVDYMTERYGLRFDPAKFVIVYDIFASNIMPSFEVLTIQ